MSEREEQLEQQVLLMRGVMAELIGAVDMLTAQGKPEEVSIENWELLVHGANQARDVFNIMIEADNPL